MRDETIAVGLQATPQHGKRIIIRSVDSMHIVVTIGQQAQPRLDISDRRGDGLRRPEDGGLTGGIHRFTGHAVKAGER